MIVYQVLPDGRFGGEVEADEHPLREGEYLIPAACVTAKPPQKTGYYPVWNGKTWNLLPIQNEPVPQEPEIPMRDEWADTCEKAAFLLRLADESIAAAVTAGSDVPQEWKDYRLALVAIVDKQASSPSEVIWPEQPVPIKAPKSPKTVLFKTDIYTRMTDEELSAFETGMETADTRTRLMWRDCLQVDVNSPLFPLLQASLTQAFGADRAAQILSLEA